jgi:hypothetical protein
MLNNMKYWLHNFLFSNTQLLYATSNSQQSLKSPLINKDGTKVTKFNAYYSLWCSMLGVQSSKTNHDNYGVTIRLGTGSTIPTTEETYCLENEVTLSFTLGSITSDVAYPTGKVRLVLTANYTNNTTEAITINEAGLATYIYGPSQYETILLDRKSVADGNFTPVTVGAGESKIFVYAIEL